MKTPRSPIPKMLAVLASLLFITFYGSPLAFGQGASLGNGASMEVLGVGTGALLRSPLTDPENDGNEAAGPTDPSWNWVSITSNSERGFDAVAVDGFPAGTERSYNVFDHLASGGGAAKWCCGEPIGSGAALATTPLQITVQLNDIYRLTHFTVTSGNDTPTRDPANWQILGSNDGITFDPIFTQIAGGDTATTSLWGATRDQVIKFSLTNPAKAFSYIRFECTATYILGTGAFFQLDEIEYYGLQGPAELEEKTIGIGTAALIKGDQTDPDNNGSKTLGSTDASWNWKAITANNKAAFDTDGAFNVFDNSVGTGTDKWCCDDATAESPKSVTVEFDKPLVLTHFTITSGNDAPDGDPIKFQMLGSTDGVAFTPFYTRDKPTALWTARNQIAKITLKDPTPPYKFIRYEATETAGATHAVAEIELFGKFGGLSNPGVSGILNAANFLQLKVRDGVDTMLDPSTIKLLVDGVAITPVLSKNADVTSLLYDRSPLFASATAHTYALTAKDNFGNPLVRNGSFTTPAHTTINAALAIASVDTNKPGFRMKAHQMSFNKNPGVANIPNAERQIANGYFDSITGLPVENTMDFTFIEPDGSFIDTETINFNGEGAPNPFQLFSNTALPPQDREDKPVPGIPGGNGTDRYVQSIETILELKTGLYRFGIVSDDGSRLSFGRGPGDVIGTQLTSAGGTVNTTVDVVITADGFYPVRLLWFETGGGSGVEFFTVNVVTGERTLINDPLVATAVKAYRGSEVGRPFVSRVLPSNGYQFAFANEDIVVDITDAGLAVDPTTIRLLLNNVAVTVTPVKVENVTSIKRVGSLSNLLPAGVNTVNIIYGFTESTRLVTVTNTYTYTVPAYTRPIPPGNRVAVADVSGNGFRVRAHQMDRSLNGNQGNGGRHTGQNMPGPEIQLNDGYIDPVTNLPYPNLADLSAFGPDGTLELYGTLNFNVPSLLDPAYPIGGTGIFQRGSDTVMPGLPGRGTSPIAPAVPASNTAAVGTENTVHEFTSYLELKAGVYMFGVNADDGWVAYSSPNPRDTLGTILGYRNAPGGNTGYPLTVAPATFNVVVQEDGIYPFRILFAQGGGGVNIEFMTVDRNTGQMTLVNDSSALLPTTAGAEVASPIAAYSTYTGAVRPWVKNSVYPMPNIGTATPLVTAGNAGPTLWQNRDQQSGPGPITRKLGLLNGNWNSGEIQNSSTAQRPFGDAVGAIVADLGAGSVGMVLNGVSVTPTVTAVAGSTDKLVLYTPPVALSSTANHVAGLIYAGTTNYWVFNVITNVSVSGTNALASNAGIAAARGFRVKVAQSTTGRTGNTMAAAELQLAGTPASVTPAGAGPGGSYVVPGIINFSSRRVPGQTGAEIGNFQTLMSTPADEAIPGLPGTGLTGAAGLNNFTAEIFAYLDLPAGYQKFGVNGDDGWKVQIGDPGQTNGPILYTLDRGAGAQDFPFAFITPQAGLYPVRLVWWQGGGDANLEFFTYGPNNEKIPVNSANGVKAYYNAVGSPFNIPKITLGATVNGTLNLTWINGGQLETAPTVQGPWTGTGDSDGSYSEVISEGAGAKFYRVKQTQ